MSISPLVSIIIPKKNRTTLFLSVFESLQNQSMTDWEAIIIDDHSTKIELQSLMLVIADDPRFSVILNTNRSGACEARNLGFERSNSPYVLFLDSDDALATHCLKQRVDCLEDHPELDFVVAETMVFNSVPGDSDLLWNTFTERDDLNRFLEGDSPWNTSGPMWRRQSLDRTGLKWPRQTKIWQDRLFHVDALSRKMQYKKLSEPDCYWRSPTQQGSIGQSANLPSTVINRARSLKRITLQLRQRGLLHDYRRSILGAQFFQLAFRTNLRLKHQRLVWTHARKSQAASSYCFFSVLALEAFERAVSKISRKIICRILPSLPNTPRYCVKSNTELRRVRN